MNFAARVILQLRSLALAAMIIAAMVVPSFARAEKITCHIRKRTDTYYTGRLPKEIVGWINCPKTTANLNTFYIVKMPAAGRAPAIEWLRRFDRFTTEGSEGVDEVSESKRASRVEVKSRIDSGASVHIMSYTENESTPSFAIVYDESPARIHKTRAQAEALEAVFMRAAYAQKIAHALAK